MTGTAVHIPALETERLTLRAPRISDFDAYAKMVTSPRACYMEPGLDREGAWVWFATGVANWIFMGFGALMIDINETGETIGEVSINSGPKFPETEFGWMLYDGAEGKGFATEAAIALRGWAVRANQLKTLVSYIDPDNSASIRLAERLGAVPDPDAERPDPGDLVYRHPLREALN